MTKKKKTQNKLDEAVKNFEAGQLSVFKTTRQLNNMRIDQILVPQNIVAEMIAVYTLPVSQQERAVNKLVDRTPHWLELSSEEQTNEIKAVLTLETVAYYLYNQNVIQDDCDMYENGFDKEGNVVLDAFYITEKKTQADIEALRQEKQTAQKKAINDKIISFPNKKEGNACQKK